MLLLTLVTALAVAASINALELSIKFDKQGLFRVFIDQDLWFESGEVFIRHSNRFYSTEDETLKLTQFQETTEQDKLGEYKKYNLTYQSVDEGTFDGVIKQYTNFIIFAQIFNSPLKETTSTDADSLITAFPTFLIKDSHRPAGSAHWISWYYQTTPEEQPADRRKLLVAPGFTSPTYTEWTSRTRLVGGVGGSGVTAIYDENAKTTVILSAFKNPMVMSHVSPTPGSLQFGVMGNVTEIPADFSVETVLFASSRGINEGMREWGELLRETNNKIGFEEARESDLTLRYLGYTTDNGAYYYYHTEGGKNYEETLVGVYEYSLKVGIPYKYVLLDSWWYFKGSNGGVSDWSALPDVFPQGIASLHNRTGWLVQAHNRYWALDNVYSTNQGGSFQFVEDPVKNGAAPIEPDFWRDLFTGKRESWGLIVYEQDWLFNEFYEYVSQMLESVDLGRRWLLQMGQGALAGGLKIQYCMPYVRHLLQSVEVPVVSQARASDDYVVSPFEGVENWRIGGQSVLIAALGLAPSKDGYWSSSRQPGNPYGEDRYEPYPRLHSAVAVLSAGPVAIADGIGFSDVTLIMRSCTKDGRLLQPTTPALRIDAAHLQVTFGNSTNNNMPPIGPKGEVWFAPSFQGEQEYGSILVVDLAEDWEIRPSDVGLFNDAEGFIVRESNVTDDFIFWSEQEPLKLKACGLSDFSLFSASPVVHGFAFLGEVDKWVPFSQDRFNIVAVVTEENIEYTLQRDLPYEDLPVMMARAETNFMASASETGGEIVKVSFLLPSGELKVVECVVGRTGGGVIFLSDGRCI